jgi:hypothetical protein
VPEEIWIDIAENGDVTIEGKSATLGNDCKALTAEIEKALGTVMKTVTKPEFHRARAVTRKAGA